MDKIDLTLEKWKQEIKRKEFILTLVKEEKEINEALIENIEVLKIIGRAFYRYGNQMSGRTIHGLKFPSQELLG